MQHPKACYTNYCLQESPKLNIELVCMMEKIENISPVLADTVMEAGYYAIDVLFSEVSHICST